MKNPVTILALAVLPLAAPCTQLPRLPPPAFADTEVSTNIPFVVGLDAVSRLEFSLSLDASPSNCVEVSIGRDADGDGELSPREAAHAFGFDCGWWFARDSASGSVTRTGCPGPGRAERRFVLRRGRLDVSWDLVRVVRRGIPDALEVAVVEGRRPGMVLEVR